MKSCGYTGIQKNLIQQGFASFTPRELKQMEWGLRLTPTLCAIMVASALLWQLPGLLFIVAALGVIGFFWPAYHPFDLLYNHGLRHLFNAVAIPPSPFQRRLSCFAAAVMSLTIAAALLLGSPLVAYSLGAILLSLQAIVISTHFCTLSWVYEGIMRLLGKWESFLDHEQARQLLQQGAILVDVRSPMEYQREHIPNSHNYPLENIEKYAVHLKDSIALLYCASGTRSHIAMQKLRLLGIPTVHNLGGIQRVRLWLDTLA